MFESQSLLAQQSQWNSQDVLPLSQVSSESLSQGGVGALVQGVQKSRSQVSMESQSSDWSGFKGLSSSQPVVGTDFQKRNHSQRSEDLSQRVSQEKTGSKLKKRSLSQSRSISGSLDVLKIKRSKSCASIDQEIDPDSFPNGVLPDSKIPRLNLVRALATAARKPTVSITLL